MHREGASKGSREKRGKEGVRKQGSEGWGQQGGRGSHGGSKRDSERRTEQWREGASKQGSYCMYDYADLRKTRHLYTVM